MAKQFYSGNASNASDINKFLGNFDKEGALLSEYKTAEVGEWIHTGSYVLNACISGSILRGTPAGRIITISGDPKSGKSYICLDMMRELQKKGYFCIYFDTENATSSARFTAQGVDPTKVRIVTPETVNDVTVMLTQLTQSLIDTKNQNEVKNKKLPEDQQLQLPKIAIFIDSITALNSSKQMNDALEGVIKMDMGTVAKEMKLLFNMITPRIGKLGIPMICTAHEYAVTEGYQTVKVISGGRGATYLSSVIVSLRKRFEKDENKMKRGIFVTATISESRFSKHRPVEFYISFSRGINQYVGLQEFISWDVCGITRGKMVNYVDSASELLSKKVASSTEELLHKKFSTNELRKLLSIPKKEAFKVSFESDIAYGLIKIVSKDSTIVLPDLVTYLQANDHNVNLEFEFSFLKEKMILNGIYSDAGIEKLISSYLESGDLYVIGNGKLDINKNQKLKFKKPIVDSVNSGSYEERIIEVELEEAVGSYNEKIDQLFVFTDKYKSERVDKSGNITSPQSLICMPNNSSPDWIVRHLNRTVKDAELFNGKVFSPEVLKEIDEKIIIPAFSYRESYETMDGEFSEEESSDAIASEATGDWDEFMNEMQGKQ